MPVAFVDRAEALVCLEQQRPSVRSVDRHVDLEELSVATLEMVLALLEVADVRVELVRAQGPMLAGAKHVSNTDKTRLIRIHNASLQHPDLDPHDRVAQDAPADEAIEAPNRARVARDHTGRDT